MSVWTDRISQWLTLRRLRAQAILLALCLWGVCAIDFATPGPLDRAGNIKFQDLLPFYISAHLIAAHRAAELYDLGTMQREMQSIVEQSTRVRLTYLYPPHTALCFMPLTKFSFAAAARIWAALSLVIYFACIYAIWKKSASLRSHAAMVALTSLAYPPLFHTFVRGQFSAVILACFTLAFLALHADRPFLAGVALGCLALKPSFLVAIPLILLLAAAWKILGGLLISAASQAALARLCFGAEVTRDYVDMLMHPSQWLGTAELNYAAIQMHSLRAFWSLLVPSRTLALALYLLSSIAAIALAALIWKSSQPLQLRFAALILVLVLVNPHLFIYDLLVLAPALLLILDCTLTHSPHSISAPLPVLCYLAFILPLFGPVARWTHVQLSVIAFALLLWTLRRLQATPTHQPA